MGETARVIADKRQGKSRGGENRKRAGRLKAVKEKQKEGVWIEEVYVSGMLSEGLIADDASLSPASLNFSSLSAFSNYTHTHTLRLLPRLPSVVSLFPALQFKLLHPASIHSNLYSSLSISPSSHQQARAARSLFLELLHPLAALVRVCVCERSVYMCVHAFLIY